MKLKTVILIALMIVPLLAQGPAVPEQRVEGLPARDSIESTESPTASAKPLTNRIDDEVFPEPDPPKRQFNTGKSSQKSKVSEKDAAAKVETTESGERSANRGVLHNLQLLIKIFAIAGTVYFVMGFRRRCPKCKKMWARKTTDSKLISQWHGTKVENKTDVHKNNLGQTTGTTERKETVPVVYSRYRYWRKCKFCGHRWTTESTHET